MVISPILVNSVLLAGLACFSYAIGIHACRNKSKTMISVIFMFAGLFTTFGMCRSGNAG